MAQAGTTDTRSSFIAQLLMPLAPKEMRRLAAEARDEAEKAWSLVYHRYWAAKARRQYCAHQRAAAILVHRRHDGPETAEENVAQAELVAAVDRLMRVPAPTVGSLRLKQKVRMIDGGREQWNAAIMVDEARLL